jgi:hypothetical protein
MNKNSKANRSLARKNYVASKRNNATTVFSIPVADAGPKLRSRNQTITACHQPRKSRFPKVARKATKRFKEEVAELAAA